MAVRAAQLGDLFLLLLPAEQRQATTPTWQTMWQACYGGRYTQPLHVSLQRFRCADPAQLTALLETLPVATTAIDPIALTGIGLQPLLSHFRQNTILKCRLQPNTALHALADLMRVQLTQQNLIPDFPWYPDLVTVLEGIAPLPAREIMLDAPQPLFVGSQLLLSRVVARNHYLPLGQWQFVNQTTNRGENQR